MNLIMVDFAGKDSRSVAAMLRGRGDGRERRFVDFMNAETLKDPVLTEEELVEVYTTQAHAEYHREKSTPGKLNGTWERGLVTA